MGKILKNRWLNRGLIEALSIQVPERLLGRELVYVAPKRFRYHEVAKESFLESLIWRDLSQKNGKPKFIDQRRVLNYLNKYILPYFEGNEKILNTIITVSAIPDHPLNADLLHQHLRKHKLPQRDAFWLPYLNNYYGDESSVNRLLVWGLDGLGKDKIQNKSLRLAGITLAWFLASSNRFLRDRATKALVTIFVERLIVLLDILKKFEKIDDPYIEERLYAAAYGSVLQSKEDVTKLALYVYNRFFKNSKPPTHILLRDYARGIIKTALNKNTALKHKINVAKIRPPYSSTFPTKIPSLAELKRKYYPERIISKPPKLGDYGEIWRSLMYNNEGGISDFGNYVVNTALNHWCDLKLSKDGSRKKTAKEMNEEFITSLDRKKKSAWRKLEDMRQSMFLRMTILDFPKKENVNSSDVKITIKQLQAIKRQH